MTPAFFHSPTIPDWCTLPILTFTAWNVAAGFIAFYLTSLSNQERHTNRHTLLLFSLSGAWPGILAAWILSPRWKTTPKDHVALAATGVTGLLIWGTLLIHFGCLVI